MKVFEARQIREIDEYTIRHEPVASIDLMERAALGCVNWLSLRIKPDEHIKIFAGPGNNGGDGWAVARILADRGYLRVSIFLLQISRIISGDSLVNRHRLEEQNKVPVFEISRESDFPLIDIHDVIIDALFGSGLSRPLEGLSAALVKHINSSGCTVVAIDIPSGLKTDDPGINTENAIIRASHTLTFEFPKRSFFYAENAIYTGTWHIISIGLHPSVISEIETPFHYLLMEDIHKIFRKRIKFAHKGLFGHALLIAGSYGMAGAAILAARAAMRSGVGLLTTHVPGTVYPIIQGAVPESIFDIDSNERFFSGLTGGKHFAAIGIGPGTGTNDMSIKAFESILKNGDIPLVIDADALNILSEKQQLCGLLPALSILTPHPGEFDRLAGKSDSGFIRNQKQIEFAIKHNIIVLLKGAFTSIAMPDGTCYFNSTGNPGMSTAGSGDVLTGIILSLLAQGYPSSDAALLGAFIHGLAGDLAAQVFGQQAMIASDIIDNLGKAFLKIENHDTYA
jgi:ADP-dependent NAD(P)H-hydrate dehydratase / NAD(P)H-hydrate epimerase